MDDEKAVLTSLRQELSHGLGEGFWFELAETAEEALEITHDLLAQGHCPSVVITDQIMPGMKGDVLLQRLETLCPGIGKILLTGESDYRPGDASLGSIRFACLSKPWDVAQLRAAVLSAMPQSSLPG